METVTSGVQQLAAFIAAGVQQGGLIAWVLVAMFIWSVAIIIIKLLALRRSAVIRPDVVKHIEELLLANRLPEALAYCRKHSFPMARVILAGILHYDRNEAELKERLEEAGRQEIPAIRKHLTTLRSLAAVGPLIGLFGTVVGMISVFSVLSQGTAIEAPELAGGIATALVTTALGLLVATPSIVFYNDMTRRVGNLVIEMERISLHMVAVLKRAGQ